MKESIKWKHVYKQSDHLSPSHVMPDYNHYLSQYHNALRNSKYKEEAPTVK